MSSTNSVSKKNAPWHTWVVSAAFAVPISLSAGSFGSKPIDITLADVWLLIFAFIFLVKAALAHSSDKVASKTALAISFIPIFYFLIIGIIGDLTNGAPLSNIISAARFVKQFVFVIIGWQIFRIYKQTIIRPFLVTCILMQFTLVASDLIWGNFPLGCGIESRWGGCFLQAEVYGFPNSSASFQVFMTGLMVAAAFVLPSFKKLLIPIAALGAMLAIFSLSRAAWIYMGWIIMWVWIVLLNGRQKILSIALATPPIIMLTGYIANSDMSFIIGIISKIERTTGDDPSSGRFSIWTDAANLISTQPIFGYKFDYFSDYVVDFDTPHNQYLEIAFKSGMTGLLIYSLIIAMLWRSISNKKLNINLKVQQFLKWGVLTGLLLNGIFQPIFSYFMVANLIMMLIGYSLSAIEFEPPAQQHETTPAKSR